MTAVLAVDAAVRTWVVTHRLAWLDGPMWMLSVVGRSGLVFLAIALAVAIARRRAWVLIEVAIAVAIAATLADGVLKPLVHRPRPFAAMPGPNVIGGRPDDWSFPSGHASNAFAGAAALARSVPGGAAAWWTLAAAIAFSRVYLGVHYPLDVTAGALIGLCAAAVAHWVTSRRSRLRR